MRFEKGDMVRTRNRRIETVVCVNRHGNVETVDSRGYKGGEYHPANLIKVYRSEKLGCFVTVPEE